VQLGFSSLSHSLLYISRSIARLCYRCKFATLERRFVVVVVIVAVVIAIAVDIVVVASLAVLLFLRL